MSSGFLDPFYYTPLGGDAKVVDSAKSWVDNTKNCKRDLLIKKIAVGVIVALGVALTATGLGLPLGALAISGGLMLGLGIISFIGYSVLGMGWRDYSDPEVAKEVIEDIRSIDVEAFGATMSDSAKARTIQKIHIYIEYGFISEEDGKAMGECLLEAHRLWHTPMNAVDSMENSRLLDENNKNWNEVFNRVKQKLTYMEEYIDRQKNFSKYLDFVQQ